MVQRARVHVLGVSIGGLALAACVSGALAQTQEQTPTLKDRVDAAVATVTGSPMADADMKHVLDALKKLDPKPIEKLSPAEARQQPSAADAVKELLKEEGKSTAPEPGVSTKDATYAGPGGSLPARVYTPEGAGGQPLPVVVYYHGGGFVIADLDTYDATPRAIAKMANAVVVSIEYRHAPENKFPAAHEDAFAAYRWVAENAKSFGGDPARLAIMGESAGGNLAINTAIAARDQNAQKPVYVVSVYPMAGTDLNTPSYKENSNAKPLNKPMMQWFYDHAKRSDADLQDPRLDIVGKTNLKGLPPTTVVTDEIDPLRSEGQALADKLRQAGVTVQARDYKGVTHEFFGMGNVVQKAKEAETAVSQDLKAAFASPAPAR